MDEAATAPQGARPQVIVHVCNDVGAWGKGFELTVSKRWPALEQRCRQWHRGGDWAEVQQIVEQELIERRIAVTVYDLA